MFRIGCLVRKKNVTCTIFSAFYTKPNANVHGNHYTSTYFILSRLSDRLIFRNSLSSGQKTSVCQSTPLKIALHVSTCIIHV